MRTYEAARGKIPIGKNVIVTDEFGNKLISTYPKRAKGLIKKGRAEQVGENEIRLKSCSVTPCLEDNMNTTNNTDNRNSIIINPETGEVTEVTSEIPANGADFLRNNEPRSVERSENTDGGRLDPSDLSNPSDQDEANELRREAKSLEAVKLFFNAREWKPSKECEKTAATRSFISDPFGSLTEAYTVGDWSWNWSQIETKDMTLEKNTDYEFIFWLNGGENDQNQEICRFEIMFDNDHDNRYIYNLNRNFIRYIKHYKGWYLYSIPFNTGDACYTKFRFIAQRAYSTLMKAQPVESYSDLPEDIPPKGVPQRHNIIFSEGWPRNQWWSKIVFHDEDGSGRNEPSGSNKGGVKFDDLIGNFGDIAESIRSRIMEELENEIDPDEIADDVFDDVMDDIDVDSIKEQIIRQIKDSVNFDI